MKLFESDIVRWLWRIMVTLAACWCGGNITGFLLGFILESFGFTVFAITSTVMSYFLFWFAWFGLPSLIAVNYKTQLHGHILQTNTAVLIVFFAFIALMVSSVSSAIYLIGEVCQTYPERPMLLWLIAVPFLGFIYFIAHKLDKSM